MFISFPPSLLVPSRSDPHITWVGPLLFECLHGYHDHNKCRRKTLMGFYDTPSLFANSSLSNLLVAVTERLEHELSGCSLMLHTVINFYMCVVGGHSGVQRDSPLFGGQLMSWLVVSELINICSAGGC